MLRIHTRWWSRSPFLSQSYFRVNLQRDTEVRTSTCTVSTHTTADLQLEPAGRTGSPARLSTIDCFPANAR
jgi:hypothetical protein